MRAECRQARFDRLLVADVGEIVVEDGKPRAATGRRRNSGLAHGGQQADGLEQNRFAAGVRPRHDERALGRTHLEIEWYHLQTACEEQRVASVVNRPSIARQAEQRRYAIVRNRECSARMQRVELHQGLQRAFKAVAQWPNLLRQLREDALHLFALLDLHLTDTVSKLHRSWRLDEERASGRRGVVHNSVHRAPTFAPHGNHISAVAHRDRHVGYTIRFVQFRHLLLQQSNQLSFRSAQVAAQLAQRRRCVVLHGRVVRDALVDRRFDGSILYQSVDKREEHGARGCRTLFVAERLARAARGTEQLPRREQLGRAPRKPGDAQPVQ